MAAPAYQGLLEKGEEWDKEQSREGCVEAGKGAAPLVSSPPFQPQLTCLGTKLLGRTIRAVEAYLWTKEQTFSYLDESFGAAPLPAGCSMQSGGEAALAGGCWWWWWIGLGSKTAIHKYLPVHKFY